MISIILTTLCSLPRSFNPVTNNLNEPRTPIDEDTIVTLDPDSGKVMESWGKGMFYMPHGLTIDGEGNTYVTDVGLHQVMRVGKQNFYLLDHCALLFTVLKS
jgi:hypothetical protein